MIKIITITADELGADKISTGSVADICALATGYQTSEDIFFDEYWSPEYTLEQYDYEAETIRRINKGVNRFGISPAKRKKMIASTLMPGAWVALNEPGIFEENIAYLKELCKDGAYDASIEDAPEGYPANLAAELVKDRTTYADSQYNEWLHGDRSSAGVLGETSELLTGERGNVDIKNNSLLVSFDTETIDDEYETAIDGQAYNPKRKDLIIARLFDTANAKYQTERARRTKDRAQREATAKYQAEQKAIADADRRKKLLAMKKRGAISA